MFENHHSFDVRLARMYMLKIEIKANGTSIRKKRREIPFNANFMANNDELQILLHVTWEVHEYIFTRIDVYEAPIIWN